MKLKTRKNKSQRIYDYLKEQLDSGCYEVGSLLPSLKHISTEFNTSRVTVAKAIMPLIESGILTSKAGYGTYVKKSLNSIKTKPQRFGVLIPKFEDMILLDPLFTQVSGLSLQYNFDLIWESGITQNEKVYRFAERLAKRYVSLETDGVFFMPLKGSKCAVETNLRVLKLFEKSQIPVVLLERNYKSDELESNSDVIEIDKYDSGLQLGTFLTQNKECRRIALVYKFESNESADSIIKGIQASYLKINRTDLSILKVTSESNDYTELANEIVSTEKIDALITHEMSISEIVKALENESYPHCKELTICTSNCDKYASFLKIPHTYIHKPYADLASNALELMLSRVKNPKMSRRIILMKGRLKSSQ